MPKNEEAPQTDSDSECLFQYIGSGKIKVSPGIITPTEIYTVGKPSYSEQAQIQSDYRRYYEERHPFGISKRSRTRLFTVLGLATTWLLFNLAFGYQILYPIATIITVASLIAYAKIRLQGFVYGLKSGIFLGVQRAYNLTDQQSEEIRDVYYAG